MSMDNDPHGIKEAMSELAVTEVPRLERIQAGLALVAAGESYRHAAKVCDIPATVLHYHKSNPKRQKVEREKRVKLEETELIDKQFAIANLGSEKIFERVAADSMKDGDLIKAVGVATDKIGMYRQWNKGQAANSDDEGMTTLAQLLSGKRVTIEDKSPGDDAVDVKGERVDE